MALSVYTCSQNKAPPHTFRCRCILILWDGWTPEQLIDFRCDLAINYFHCTLAVWAVLIQTSVSVCFLQRHPTLIHISTQITPLSTAALSAYNRTGTLDQLSDSHQLITSHSSPTSLVWSCSAPQGDAFLQPAVYPSICLCFSLLLFIRA